MMDLDVEVEYDRHNNVYYFYMTGLDIVILGDGPHTPSEDDLMWGYRKDFDV